MTKPTILITGMTVYFHEDPEACIKHEEPCLECEFCGDCGQRENPDMEEEMEDE
jgi:hypothetical protein